MAKATIPRYWTEFSLHTSNGTCFKNYYCLKVTVPHLSSGLNLTQVDQKTTSGLTIVFIFKTSKVHSMRPVFNHISIVTP